MEATNDPIRQTWEILDLVSIFGPMTEDEPGPREAVNGFLTEVSDEILRLLGGSSRGGAS